MSDVAIRVQGLGKQYRIGGPQARYRTIRESLIEAAKAPFRRLSSALRGEGSGADGDTIWALKDVSFEVERGEVVGVIGRNGAGKSTLLKVLSRITEPTEGWAEIHGRVGSLLEVGTGFHPELTGQENIYLSGAVLGMRREEIDRRFDAIVDFSRVEQFLDTPLKHYSSGMQVRLGFAVAAHLEPEILLVDEVLAVGDAEFQKKCLGKMGEVAQGGRTVLFVSHNMRAITGLCKRTVWIDRGYLQCEGEPEAVVGSYLSSGISATGSWRRPSCTSTTSELGLLGAKVCEANSLPVSVVPSNRSFRIEIDYEVGSRLRDSSIILRLTDMNGAVVFTSWDTDSNESIPHDREPGTYRSTCRVPAHLLRPGRYAITIAAHIHQIRLLDFQENVLTFDVSDVGFRLNKERLGVISPILDWVIERT
jgi:lipopolysaccharide transport system ATP-binding protein